MGNPTTTLAVLFSPWKMHVNRSLSKKKEKKRKSLPIFDTLLYKSLPSSATLVIFFIGIDGRRHDTLSHSKLKIYINGVGRLKLGLQCP